MESKARPDEARVTAILIGASFLAGLDLFIVNVAFDDIGRDFSAAHTRLARRPQLDPQRLRGRVRRAAHPDWDG